MNNNTAIIAYKNKKIKENLRIYIAYFKIKFLNEIQYKTAAIAGILTQFAWGFMNVMLYSAFLSGKQTNYSIQQMCTYIWLNQAFFTLFSIWSIDQEILEECRTGAISIELVKPVDLYYIWHSRTLGTKAAKIALRALPIIIICMMPFLGQYKLMPPATFTTLILSVITLALSGGIMMAYVMLLYITIMKTVTSQGIRTAFYLVFNFCSGSLIPIPFLPEVVIKILKFTPFYYMQNVSSNIYNGYITEISEIVKILVIQIIWLIALTIIGKKLMKKRIRKIEVNGG